MTIYGTGMVRMVEAWQLQLAGAGHQPLARHRGILRASNTLQGCWAVSASRAFQELSFNGRLAPTNAAIRGRRDVRRGRRSSPRRRKEKSSKPSEPVSIKHISPPAPFPLPASSPPASLPIATIALL